MFTSYCIIFSSSTDYGFLVHSITNSCCWRDWRRRRVDPPRNLIWINMVDLGLGCYQADWTERGVLPDICGGYMQVLLSHIHIMEFSLNE